MIISVVAHKGGVGKSSISVHLSGIYAERESKVLLCDVDPQHSLSSTFIDDVYAVNPSMKDVLYDAGVTAEEAITKTKFENIHIIPSNLELGEVELELREDAGWPYLLIDKLEPVKDDYSVVLIDTPPNLSTFPNLALVASDYVLIPLECSSYAVKTTTFVLNAIKKIKQTENPELEVLGLIINRIDTRRTLEKDYADYIRQHFGDKVFQTEIKNSVNYAEAVTLKTPINFYKRKSEQAEAYRQLLKEITNNERS